MLRLVAVPGLLTGLLLAVPQPTEIPEAISSDLVTDLLITAGVHVVGESLFMRRSGCAPTFDVEGIEVYAGPATLPPGGSSGTCGVIAMRTRRGG
jgi:hypothetical protein